MLRSQAIVVIVLIGRITQCEAADASPQDFKPDPLSVQHFGAGYRYPQAGWIVLHIEGEPYERGYQHGRLLTNEIAAYLRCSAQMRGHKAPAEAWTNTRLLVNALFLRRYDKEYLEEMKGIADGAAAGGAKFEGRPVDLIDIVAMNAWPEIETLDSALEATPTGLEGIRFKHDQPRQMPPDKAEHCSAFAATGPATADGKIVFGHITMFGLYPSLFYNVWIDIKPAKGHRVMMQTFPGGMNSGMDYYYNDAGLLVCETTIAQTRFDITGKALASRIRNVMQYSDSIDKAVEILKDGNNGLYTNEWLLGDIKTNEIAMFELGTHKTKLYRSSKNEWFGGAEGFYWGCNNAKDLDVRLETVASLKDAPANVVWKPSERDKMWLKLYRENKGKIDVEFGKRAFTTPPVAAYHSLDAKFTTTDLAKDLKTWALYGPPLGKAWQPTHDERQKYPEVRAMVSNPWTVLHANPPPNKTPGVLVADLDEKAEKAKPESEKEADHRTQPGPVWRGTILPKTDADIWLAVAFAEYERFVREEKSLQRPMARKTDQLVRANAERKRLNEAMREEMGFSLKYRWWPQADYAKLRRDLDEQFEVLKSVVAGTELSAEDRRKLGLKLFAHRADHAAGGRALGDVPLDHVQPDPAQNDWYKIASGKGVLVLHELRRLMGDDKFIERMDSFGVANAGKPISVEDFKRHMSYSSDDFFKYWTRRKEFPEIKLKNANFNSSKNGFLVEGEVVKVSGPPELCVDVTIETNNGELTRTIKLDNERNEFRIESEDRPKRLVVDKYGWTPKTADLTYNIGAFLGQLDKTLIVYGTKTEEASNREAAEMLQRRIVQSGSNITVPMKADRDIKDGDELIGKHVLLIGRPDTLAQDGFGIDLVEFGRGSFRIDTVRYAHPGSSVIAAVSYGHKSFVLLAGLSAESTWNLPEKLWQAGNAQVAIFPANGTPKLMVVPRRELVHEFK